LIYTYSYMKKFYLYYFSKDTYTQIRSRREEKKMK
jgi:hypothetical protein